MLFRTRNFGLATALILAGTPALVAQGTQTATIAGEVVDSSGRAISDARVRLTSPALQGERTLMTDAKGRFRAPLLPPGEYKITVTKDGFSAVNVSQRVGLEQTFNPRFVMKGTESATVEVVAGAVAAEKTEFKQAVNYTKETIDTLPVSRANLLDIAYLAPGVVENASSARGGVQIRGSMGTGNLFLVDGQNVQDNLYNGQRIPIIFDTVEETQVLTGALPAEYGDVEGGVVNSITKSGGDEFTASLRLDLKNPGNDAVSPYTNRDAIQYAWNTERSVQIGGPIIKSKLWFHFGYFSANPTPTMVAGGSGIWAVGTPGGASVDADGNLNPGGGFNYTREDRDYRREFKLTWAINENHTLSASYHANQNDRHNADYGAGDRSNLLKLITKGEFWNVQLRSMLSSSATLSVKVGQKHQDFPNSGGGVDPNIWALYNFDDGYGYRNQWFDPRDPNPDKRDNTTANVKFSYFLHAAGSHQIDVGVDYYKGTTQASGAGSPNYFTIGGVRYNNYGINVYGLDFTGQFLFWPTYMGEAPPAAIPGGGASVDSLDGLQLMNDKATSISQGYYFNDKWEVNRHWNLQLGLRVDHYAASSALGGNTSSAWSYAPRLGAKWDLFGDSKWTMGLSYAKYNGRVLESILQNVTYVNNAPLKEWMWAPGGTYDMRYDYYPASFAAMQDLSNYYIRPDGSGYVVHNDAHLNMRIDKNLKPQQVDEWQATITRNFETGVGSGYLRMNFINKKWSHMVDYTQGNSGTVADAGLVNPDLASETQAPTNVYVRVYQNSSIPTRTYRSVELEGQLAKGAWSLGGNIVYAKLWGNFVGEGAASPGRGQGLEYYTTQDGHYMYDRNIINPEGRLPGDKPLRVRLIGTYTGKNAFGKLSLGLVFRYDTGDVFSHTRTIKRASLSLENKDPNNPNNPDTPDLSPQFGSSATQYMNNTRGDGRFPSYKYFDFSIQQDFEVMKFGSGRMLGAFVKMDVTNLFNHMQKISYSTGYENLPKGNPISDPWVQAANYGSSNGSSYWGEARAVRFSLGLKF